MDENVIEIKKQVRKVIELLEQRIILEPNRPILKTLHDRYMKAEEIISSNEDISKIMFNDERECLVIYMFILSN